MANGKRIRIPYDGELLTFDEVAMRIGLSSSRVATLWYAGQPIVRSAPKTFLYEGEMLTTHQIAERTGLAPKTVRERLRRGEAVGPKTRGRRGNLIDFKGERVTLSEVARRTGRTKGYIQLRLDRGLPLDAELRPGRPRGEGRRARRSLLESGERRIGSGAGENGLRWHEDDECLFWHLWHGGDGYGECTLDEIGRLWDLSRERVRQIVAVALDKIKRAAESGDEDAVNALEFFRHKAEQRSRSAPGYWEQASANAPGNFDLTDWNERTSAADLAARIGDEAYARAPHLKAAARGGKSAALVSRGKEPA